MQPLSGLGAIERDAQVPYAGRFVAKGIRAGDGGVGSRYRAAIYHDVVCTMSTSTLARRETP